MSHGAVKPLVSSKCAGLKGSVTVPGDKSISHRSLILSSQAIGISKISGLLEGEDVINTAKALRAMGVEIKKKGKTWIVNGVGTGGLRKPKKPIDLGNSGTGARLLMGLVSPYDFSTTFTGDASLKKRPMGRALKPLELMGISYESQEGGRMPIVLHGSSNLAPIEYELPVPSAQVKSAILLAALNTPGITTVIEPKATRDHSELMMKYFGADIKVNGKKISLKGQPELRAKNVKVPADPSSAAFLVVAALLVPNSNIKIKNVCINPLRIGLYTTLKEMGADIKFTNKRKEAGEQIADIIVKTSKLKGIKVPAARAPSMIDEYPILSVAAAFAKGKTVMDGLEELRVKESDRLSAIEKNITRCGVRAEIKGDSLTVFGCEKTPVGGATIETFMDHRLAMSFLVMGMVTSTPVKIDDGSMINTSFPGFVSLMNKLGAKIG